MGKVKRFFRNISIKKSFMLYVIIFLLLATLLSAVTINVTGDIRTNITLSYSNGTNSGQINESGVIINYIDDRIEYTSKDAFIVKACETVSSFSIPVFFSICVMAAAFLFYRSKLKRPLEILNQASAKIAGNDLGFQIQYDSRDEMGQLCTSFEKMRSSLEHNNREMWRSMEERKRLNAAFAHDLRTPLTVLRGYTDFLGKYLPNDMLKKDKVISTVSTMDSHIARLENYVESMYSLQNLEEINPVLIKTSFSMLCEQLKNSAQILCQDKEIAFASCSSSEFITVDSEIVAQVFENLISNASRYSKECIAVRLECLETILSLTVTDDGDGFSDEALKKATEPFYRGDDDSGKSHFGLGLNICRILCEKHGGKLKLNNSESGGAKVIAVFSIF